MDLQTLSISYQFERSGQLPLDNSRKFNTYNEVQSWWSTVGNFYVTLIISIGDILYYFYSLPAVTESLDNNLEVHLRKIIDDVTLAANKIDTTEIDASTTRAIKAASDILNTSIQLVDTSLKIYAQNTDASILNILDLIDADTLAKINTIETRIDNINALLQDTDLELLTTIDASVRELVNVNTLHDTSINLLNTSLNNYARRNDASIIKINYDVSTLSKNFTESLANTVGRPGNGFGSEIFNDYTNNVAYGQYSHAEGNGTRADGNFSFAGGYNSAAFGDHSFAFGDEAKTDYDHGFATGYKARATASHATALGYLTTAGGQHSFAAGYYVSTINDGEIALGINNYSDIDITLFSIGNGDPMGMSRNVVTIVNNIGNENTTDNLFIQGIGNYNGMDPYALPNIKSLLQVIREQQNMDASLYNYMNSSINEISTYIRSSSYLVWNSSTETPLSNRALSLVGAHLLYTYTKKVENTLTDLSTNIYHRLDVDEYNINHNIFDVSTDLLNNVTRIDTSITDIVSSIYKLEVSTNNIENYITNSIDPSIRYIKDHDIRIDSSVQLINTSVNTNENDISIFKNYIKDTDSSISLIDASIGLLDTSIKQMKDDIESISFTAEDLHAVQYSELSLSKRQKLQTRDNIDAVGRSEYELKAAEINILYELQKKQIKHLFVYESEYENLLTYLPNALYMIIPDNSMQTLAKLSDRSINIDDLNGANVSTRIPVSANYDIIGEGGTTLGSYKFVISLKSGWRWNDYTIDPLIVTYTITGEEIYTWQLGDKLPIVLS